MLKLSVSLFSKTSEYSILSEKIFNSWNVQETFWFLITVTPVATATAETATTDAAVATVELTVDAADEAAPEELDALEEDPEDEEDEEETEEDSLPLFNSSLSCSFFSSR